MPNFNRVLYESVRSAVPGVPFATVLTAMADLPPRFWIEPGQVQTIVCGASRAIDQARAAGYSDRQLVLTSGMVIRPSFYAVGAEREAGLRAGLGLDEGRPTGVVMFGGQGSRQMLRIARDLDDVQLVLMYGHNEALARSLTGLKRRAPHVALGFTEDVAAAMRLGDFFIGKPGPGCLSETLHLGLPMIMFRNEWTTPQERCNTDWVGERGVPLLIPSLARQPAAVRTMTGRLDAFRATVAGIDNRAVFEVPEVFTGLLARDVKAVPIAEPPASRAILAPAVND